MSTDGNTKFGYAHQTGKGEGQAEALKACNKLYAVLGELHAKGLIKDYAFALARSALMLIETIAVPSYSMMNLEEAKEQLDSDYMRYQDLEDIPF